MQHGAAYPRTSHPCVARGCPHPTEDHVATPELAAAREAVVWCTRCRRHEVRRARGSPWLLLRRGSPSRAPN